MADGDAINCDLFCIEHTFRMLAYNQPNQIDRMNNSKFCFYVVLSGQK